MRAAVVGAGLAGLTAAHELRRAGSDVVVLEARDRVGGRVWSRRLENGAVVEMGAEFLLPGNTAIREVERGPERWLDLLAELRGDLDLDRAGAVLSTWTDDPWARAAYSTSPPPELPELFARSTGPLAFAGEHLGGEFAALMEGAIRSGRRAAGAILGSHPGPGLRSGQSSMES